MTTRHSNKSLRVYWRIFVKIFVSAREFCHSNMLQKIKSDRICATCRGDKNLLQGQRFYKISPVHTKQFVAAMCRRNMLLQLVAGPVRTEWSVAVTGCCNFHLACTRLYIMHLVHHFSDECLVYWIKDELWDRHYNLHVKCLAIQKDPDGVQWFHHSYWQCKQQ